jgi:hypothetical protein
MLNALMEDYNKELSKHNAGKRHCYPHWKDFILLPLAREVGTRLNMEYEVSGVFGLRLVCYIKVTDENNFYILSITPAFSQNELDSLHYDTGERKEPWHNDLNGFGNVTMPLPESIEELIEFMKGKAGNDEN